MTKKKTVEVNRILNLTKQESQQILQMLEDLRSINGQTDDKCPIDYEMICNLEGMEHQLANIVNATVECEQGHYTRWGGAYEYK